MLLFLQRGLSAPQRWTTVKEKFALCNYHWNYWPDLNQNFRIDYWREDDLWCKTTSAILFKLMLIGTNILSLHLQHLPSTIFQCWKISTFRYLDMVTFKVNQICINFIMDKFNNIKQNYGCQGQKKHGFFHFIFIFFRKALWAGFLDWMLLHKLIQAPK